MGKVNVIIVDATGNKEQKVGLPDDVKIGIIMVKLVEKIKLPSTGPDGNPISYKFIHKVSGRQLLETQTLADAQIKDGDVLRLQPEITAGATCVKCGAELQEGQAFCPECGSSAVQPEINTGDFTPVVDHNSQKKPKRTKLVIGIIIAVCICAVLIFAANESAKTALHNKLMADEWTSISSDGDTILFLQFSEDEIDYRGFFGFIVGNRSISVLDYEVTGKNTINVRGRDIMVEFSEDGDAVTFYPSFIDSESSSFWLKSK